MKIRNYILSLLLLTIFNPFGVNAEGSRNWTGDLQSDGTWKSKKGYRAFIEYQSLEYLSIKRQQVFYAYAKEGEKILLATSTIAGNYPHEISLETPEGAVKYYDVNSKTDVGCIENVKKELAGPIQLGASDGYQSIEYEVEQTGVYKIIFYPQYVNTANPTMLKNSEDWKTTQTGMAIAAFDITVTSNKNEAIDGRVYTNYLALNASRPAEKADREVLFNNIYILTSDGYWYDTNFNGLDPYGFMFFANNRGIINSLTNASYLKSARMRTENNPGVNATEFDPLQLFLHSPATSNTNIDKTYKIFFTLPKGYDDVDSEDYQDLPRSIYPIKQDVPIASKYRFVDSSNNNTGTTANGIGGDFIFEVSEKVNERLIGQEQNAYTYQIELDFNNYVATIGGDYDLVDGVYKKVETGTGNYKIYNVYKYDTTLKNQEIKDFDNRVILSNSGIIGENKIHWDGKDALGRYVLDDDIRTFGAVLSLKSGEYHFPLIDAEYNPNGIKIELLNGNENDADTLIYYDNTEIHNHYWENNKSTLTINKEGKLGWEEGQPIKNLYGISGKNGVLKYRYNSKYADGYGENTVFDLWTYVTSESKNNNNIKIDITDKEEDYVNIKGFTFYDTDGDGIYDPLNGEYALSDIAVNVKEKTTSKEYKTKTNSYGIYNLNIPSGDYTITLPTDNCTTQNSKQEFTVSGMTTNELESYNAEIEQKHKGYGINVIPDTSKHVIDSVGYQVKSDLKVEASFGYYDDDHNFVYVNDDFNEYIGKDIYLEVTAENIGTHVAKYSLVRLNVAKELKYISYQKITGAADTIFDSYTGEWIIGDIDTNSKSQIRIKYNIDPNTINNTEVNIHATGFCNTVEETDTNNESISKIIAIASPYTATVDSAIENGIIELTKTSYYPGEKVEFSLESNKDYILDKLIITTASGKIITTTDNIFIMPEENVIISATFMIEEITLIVEETLTGNITLTENETFVNKNAELIEDTILITNDTEDYIQKEEDPIRNNPPTLNEEISCTLAFIALCECCHLTSLWVILYILVFVVSPSVLLLIVNKILKNHNGE